MASVSRSPGLVFDIFEQEMNEMADKTCYTRDSAGSLASRCGHFSSDLILRSLQNKPWKVSRALHENLPMMRRHM